MSHGDTHPEAARVQAELLRGMTGEQRVKRVFQMSNLMRRIAVARIRSEHPEWSEWEIKRELLRLAFLPDPLPPGLEEAIRERANET
jgi:hypothetical protein